MLNVVGLRVRSLDVDRNEVTWEIQNTTTDVLDHTFQVFRSESPEGPFEPVTSLFEDRYLFVDARVPSGYRDRKLWYRLRVTTKRDGTFKDFGPETIQADPDLIAQAIRRNEQTLFTQIAGRRVWLFPKRTFGYRCASCWDFTLNARKRSSCLECFDTGFLRGYLDPIEVWMQIDPHARNVQLQPQQMDTQAATTARMTFYPTVKPGDVIVEQENIRWRVAEVRNTERLRAPIRQEMRLNAIQPSDIEYKLPINLDRALRDIQASPARMFTNPTNLDSAVAEQTPEIFALYPTDPRDPRPK